MRQLDKEFVLVLIFMVFAVLGRGCLFDSCFHFPGSAIGVEDGFRFQPGVIIAPIPKRQYRTLKGTGFIMGTLEVDAAVSLQVFGIAVIDMPGIGEPKYTDQHQGKSDEQN